MKLRQKLAVTYLRTRFRVLTAVSKNRAAAKAFELFCTPQSRTLKKNLPAVFKDAEKLNFRFQNHSISGFRWNYGAGRKAMIIHGFESSVVNFEKYVNPLIAKGYEVLAFDAPAHGLSSGTKINAPLYRDLIKHVHREFGPLQSFVAHSFGGLAVCMALAEISHDHQSRLALIAPATETRTAIEQFFHFLQLSDEGVRKKFEEIIATQSGHPISWFSIPRTLKKIKAQILWLHDKDDKITPLSDVLRVKDENYLNIQFIITRGLGHRKIYKDAKIGKTIVNFL